MPVYPFLQSVFFRSGITDDTFFTQGKYFNVVLSILLLILLALIHHHYFHSFHTLNLILIYTFPVFIFKAAYFQAELLFYFLNFCLFILMWSLLKRASLFIAVITGIIAGVAHLTKASILPGLLLFFVLATVKWGITAYQYWQSNPTQISIKRLIKYVLIVPLVGITFLVVLYPFIKTSKEDFGSYFYNVNSTFYIWYDSWKEVEEGTRAFGDRVGWPEMPVEDIPSISRYLQEHTIENILDRFVTGGVRIIFNMINSYGYFKYLIIYMTLLTVICLLMWWKTKEKLKDDPILLLFIILYFTIYFLLYSWFTPIAAGNRFILAQFIPFMFTISVGLHKLLQSNRITIGRYSIQQIALLNWFVLPVLLIDIYLILSERINMIYGGS